MTSTRSDTPLLRIFLPITSSVPNNSTNRVYSSRDNVWVIRLSTLIILRFKNSIARGVPNLLLKDPRMLISSSLMNNGSTCMVLPAGEQPKYVYHLVFQVQKNYGYCKCLHIKAVQATNHIYPLESDVLLAVDAYKWDGMLFSASIYEVLAVYVFSRYQLLKP